MKQWFARVREHYPAVDHAVRAWAHYTDCRGDELAGAVTYFAFLSFFPLLALTFAAVGFLALAYPAIEAEVTRAVTTYLPGLVGTGEGQLRVEQLLNARQAALGIGAVGLLYSGLGWINGLREALRQVFVLPVRQGNFAVKKLTDLGALLMLGAGALLSLIASSVATALTHTVLDAVGLGDSGPAELLFRILAPLLSIAVTTALLLLVFTRLPGRAIPWRQALEGALLGAVGIQLLLLVGGALLRRTTDNPVYGAFAVVVGLLVWMNLLSRVTLLAASWTATDTRVPPKTDAEGGARQGTEAGLGAQPNAQPGGRRVGWARPAAVLAVAALVALRRKGTERVG